MQMAAREMGEYRSIARSMLQSGEHVIWEAPSLGTLRVTPRDVMTLLILIAIIGVMVFLLLEVVTSASGLVVTRYWFLALCPSVLCVTAIAYGAYKSLRIRAYYVLTDHRAIIVARQLWGSLRTDHYSHDALRCAKLVKRPGGSGDIVLRTRIERTRSSNYTVQDGLLDVKDVENVMRMVDHVATGQSQTATAHIEPTPTEQHVAAGGMPLTVRSLANIPPRLESTLARHLEPMEQVLWRYRPSRNQTMAQPLLAVFVSAIFVAFGVAGVTLFGVVLHGFSNANPITAGLCFVLSIVTFAGVFALVWGIASLRRARDILYVVTSRRAMLLLPKGRNGWANSSFPFAGTWSMRVEEQAGGSGDIWFAFGAPRQTLAAESGAFTAIPAVRQVADLIERARRLAQRGAST